MTDQPRVAERPAEPYVAIDAEATNETELRRAVDAGFPELFGWLAERGIPPAGSPFIRYREVDGAGDPLAFELAAPVGAPVEDGGRIRARELPAGRYAAALHVGPYSHDEVPDLGSARHGLLAWMRRQGLEPAGRQTDRGTALDAYFERYLTDPSQEPDWAKWQTELAYLIAAA